MVSSWNELTSTVSTSRSCCSSATSQSGLPMLPQAIVRCPHAFNICASNSVVVVFPFVPVMAMTGTFTDRQPNSSSPIVSIFRDEKFVASGEIGSMPGLKTTKSYDAESRPAAGPERTSTPRARRFSIVDFSRVFSSALSRTVTLAPSLRSRSAAAVPLSPAPSTATFLPWYFKIYLSFSVANPRSAKMADRIQNRTITVFSFQPLSSK